MVKHIQTIRQLLAKNCLSVFDHFVGYALKVLMTTGLLINGFTIVVNTTKDLFFCDIFIANLKTSKCKAVWNMKDVLNNFLTLWISLEFFTVASL